MSKSTNIAWCDSTSSPWFGCSRTSPGCQFCYAEELTLRHGWAGWGDNAPRVRSKGFEKNVRAMHRKPNVGIYCGEASGQESRDMNCCALCSTETDHEPIRRRRIFPSLMDWLDPKVPIEWLADFLKVIYECPNLDFLLLTKRPEIFNERMDGACMLWACDGSYRETPESRCYHDMLCQWRAGHSPRNVWIGVSVEDQKRADDRIPVLLMMPAAVRFLSVEPLLKPITFDLGGNANWHFNCLTGKQGWLSVNRHVDWVIVGGESGPNRRDCGVGAIIDVADQCKAAGVPVFVKQDSALKPGQQGRIPDDIWAIKEFPK